MNEQDHDRALDLIMRQGTEDVAAADSSWLTSHLAACSECAGFADDFESSGRWLRTVAVTATPALVETTQARLRERAASLREQRARTVLIAISFCMGVCSSAASAWLWWRFGGWVADHVGLPASIVQPGILLFLVLPAIVIAVMVMAFPHPLFEGSLMVALAREREGENQ